MFTALLASAQTGPPGTISRAPSSGAESTNQGGPGDVTITHWCEVAKTWRVGEQETLYRLEPQVVMPRETLDARYRFRPDQALSMTP